MRISFIVGAAALIGLGTVASAQTTPTTAATPTTTAAPASTPATTTVQAPVKEKLVCVTVEQLGTRLGGHKECKTKEAWADERRQNREQIDRSQTQRACGLNGC